MSRFLRYPKTLIAWLLLSVLIMIAHVLLPREYAHDASALLLTIIASIYIGFALQDGRTRVLIIEISAAAVFIVCAVLGLWLSPYFWPLGLFLHGVWDWLHHERGLPTKVPDYYPPMCVLVDWLMVVFFLLWLPFN